MTRTETLRTAAHQCIRDATDDSKDEKIEKPVKGWVNWYKIITPGGVRFDDGSFLALGELDHGRVWPTKDVAETIAAEYMSATPLTVPALSEPRKAMYEYLGAFPEGERP